MSAREQVSPRELTAVALTADELVESVGEQEPRRRTGLGRRLRRSWQLYVLLIPPIIYCVLFLYWPMYGLQLAFKDFNIMKGITASPWAGMKYVNQFVDSYLFWPVLWNTIVLNLYALVALFPLPILLALLLNQVRNARFRKTVQMITYAPYFISVVVLVGIVLMLFSPNTGIVNVPIRELTGEPIDFLGPEMFRHTYVWSGAWQTLGYSAIIYLAALAGVDPELHEAARVDGAGVLRRMWHIDLPSILPVTITLLILNMGQILSTGFEKVLLMQTPLNTSVSQVIDTYAYQVAFNSQIPQYSYATAIGLFKSIISLVMILLANWLARRVAKQSLF
ncbi:ABC transporter permease [Auraticoccus monumenti]|uniref:Carbohydrate ABC transporter membrane protein 1, CUT1 family n=1 Tax=Auraticoccus monumenti TaxID=675864 RepID=A0A1G6XYQ8_9ACTN|nr:ABC transporter permease subunit [Auraticoccus monumenti]SDD83289.1 carbohydrate ABC transporter membrane protein 1, CUT1 family [Auraticoccus monumenti]